MSLTKSSSPLFLDYDEIPATFPSQPPSDSTSTVSAALSYLYPPIRETLCACLGRVITVQGSSFPARPFSFRASERRVARVKPESTRVQRISHYAAGSGACGNTRLLLDPICSCQHALTCIDPFQETDGTNTARPFPARSFSLSPFFLPHILMQLGLTRWHARQAGEPKRIKPIVAGYHR